MNALIGSALVLVALAAASFGAVTGLVAGFWQSRRGRSLTEAAAYVFAAASVLANLVMIRALLMHDFSVSYVAQVGSRSSPTWITVVSLWSSLEGSLLFWTGVLGVFIALFVYVYRGRYHGYMAYTLGISLFVAAFFAFLVAAPAAPFASVSPVPPDGPGPNPLLQNHILMVLHPPALYLGYVGLTIPFAAALAAVLRGHLSDGWLKPMRRWTLIPWIFLTLGMVLGGWWAYEVLGWGGYWAWDPVENASLLPWLAATGYLHATIVYERRRVLVVWTLSLAMLAFLLTMLGTFMTRSGVFNSVHAFSHSSIGPLFLGFITVAAMVSLGALAGRAHLFTKGTRFESLVSRESAFLINNLVLVVFTFTVLLGTLYPLITEAVRGQKVSVGEPYFNQMAAPLGVMLVFLMGLGPALPWGRTRLSAVFRTLSMPAAGALATLVAALAFGLRELWPLLTFTLCAFALVVSVREMVCPFAERLRRRKEAPVTALSRAVRANQRRFGGQLVHVAVIIAVAAIAASHAYKRSVEASLAPGQTFSLGDYEVTFEQAIEQEQAHRVSLGAVMKVTLDGAQVAELVPRLNFYRTQREPIGAPAVRSRGLTDVYISLMSVEQDGQRVVVKAFLNPLVSWIWWSLPLVALGVLVSLWPRRRRQEATREHPAAEKAT